MFELGWLGLGLGFFRSGWVRIGPQHNTTQPARVAGLICINRSWVCRCRVMEPTGWIAVNSSQVPAQRKQMMWSGFPSKQRTQGASWSSKKQPNIFAKRLKTGLCPSKGPENASNRTQFQPKMELICSQIWACSAQNKGQSSPTRSNSNMGRPIVQASKPYASPNCLAKVPLSRRQLGRRDLLWLGL